jgi:hypothetical protein
VWHRGVAAVRPPLDYFSVWWADIRSHPDPHPSSQRPA